MGCTGRTCFEEGCDMAVRELLACECVASGGCGDGRGLGAVGPRFDNLVGAMRYFCLFSRVQVSFGKRVAKFVEF